jgi:hypothetical protein
MSLRVSEQEQIREWCGCYSWVWVYVAVSTVSVAIAGMWPMLQHVSARHDSLWQLFEAAQDVNRDGR